MKYFLLALGKTQPNQPTKKQNQPSKKKSSNRRGNKETQTMSGCRVQNSACLQFQGLSDVQLGSVPLQQKTGGVCDEGRAGSRGYNLLLLRLPRLGTGSLLGKLRSGRKKKLRYEVQMCRKREAVDVIWGSLL